MSANISVLNKTNLKSGKLINLIPEFYELKNTVENSADGWHVNESVFDHTISVMSALGKIISQNKNVKKYLVSKIGGNSKKNLLLLSALLHDVGKKEALTKDGKFTNCKGHEPISVKKSKVILKRLNLSEKETRKVLKIIANHSEFHKLLKPDNQNFKKEYSTIKKRLKDIFLELILLTYADTINSKLKNVNPTEFRHRIAFYKQETKNI